MKIILFLFIVLKVVFATSIDIKSNNATITRDKNIAKFDGDAVIKNNEMTLTANSILVNYDEKEQKINNAIANKNVKFINREKNTKADGDIGIYNAKNNLITLEGNVKVKENNMFINADSFEYDINKKITNVQSKNDNRVEIIIDK